LYSGVKVLVVHKRGALFLEEPSVNAETIDFSRDPFCSGFCASLLSDVTAVPQELIQSFDQGIVTLLGREESPKSSKKVVGVAMCVGFRDVCFATFRVLRLQFAEVRSR
jgi:hypothetical protein